MNPVMKKLTDWLVGVAFILALTTRAYAQCVAWQACPTGARCNLSDATSDTSTGSVNFRTSLLDGGNCITLPTSDQSAGSNPKIDVTMPGVSTDHYDGFCSVNLQLYNTSASVGDVVHFYTVTTDVTQGISPGSFGGHSQSVGANLYDVVNVEGVFFGPQKGLVHGGDEIIVELHAWSANGTTEIPNNGDRSSTGINCHFAKR